MVQKMNQVRNYQKELNLLIEGFIKEGKTPSLFLHACCAPCSSYCISYLSQYFNITLFYYNPNIYPESEYSHRLLEIKRFLGEFPVKNPVSFIEGEYKPQAFFEMAKGLENEPEGGKRCLLCYELRLREAAVRAAELGADYFTTTLSISPHKNAAKLNEIGERLGEEYGVLHLPSDFKKKEGYKRSIELSKEYNLYRQDYCGCLYSKDIENKKKEKKDLCQIYL